MPAARRAVLALAAAGVAAIVLFPVYWMLLTALLPGELTRSRAPALLPQWSAVEPRRVRRRAGAQAGADLARQQHRWSPRAQPC